MTVAGDAEVGLEDLDLLGLLDRLHDVVPPDPVSLLPSAPGWWVLLTWLLAAVALRGLEAQRRRVRDAYRRAALAELDRIEGRDEGLAEAIAVLLKRTALAAYPREAVATLHGDAWAAFLIRSAGDDPVVADAASSLARAAYVGDQDGRRLLGPARRWIELHRA